jgi:hypothetical protein
MRTGEQSLFEAAPGRYSDEDALATIREAIGRAIRGDVIIGKNELSELERSEQFYETRVHGGEREEKAA